MSVTHRSIEGLEFLLYNDEATDSEKQIQRRAESLMLNINKPQRLPHPLQAKFDSGELKSVNHWDISDEEWNAKISLLDEEDKETANWYRQEKKHKKHTPSLYDA
jgi:hypothetical protein